jgi:uncharacterized protein with gpF-like domain
MTTNQINEFANDFDRSSTQNEKKVYRMVFRVLKGILLTYKKEAKINIDIAIAKVNYINNSVFEKLLGEIYNEVGIVYAIETQDRLEKLKRNPTFEIGFFSELWKNNILQILRTPEITSRITKISDTTRQQIRDVLIEAKENRLTAQQTAKLMNERATVIVKNRAMLIARTETTLASSIGHAFGASTSKLQLDKVWISTKDSRTRDTHRAMNGKRVGSKEKFNVNGRLMEYPGDPNGGAKEVCNCRCTVAYVPSPRQIESNDNFLNQIIQAVVVEQGFN